jgi:hypothetical protein
LPPLVRELFPDAPLKYTPSTEHMTGNVFTCPKPPDPTLVLDGGDRLCWLVLTAATVAWRA